MAIKKQKTVLVLSLSVLVFSLAFACKKKENEEPQQDVVNSPDDGSAGQSAALFPFGLTLGSFESTDESSVVDLSVQLNRLAAGTLGTGCGFNLPNYLASTPAPSCYGAETYYSNHPDIGGWVTNIDGNYWISPGYPDDGVFGKAELGITSASEDSQACILAQVKHMVLSQVFRARMAQTMVAAAHCILKTVELPAPMQTLDFKTQMETTVSHDSRLSIGKADLIREANVGDNPVYRYEIQLKYFDIAFDVSWRHTASSDSQEYSGEILFDAVAPVSSGGYSMKWIYQKSQDVMRTYYGPRQETNPASGYKIRTEWDSVTNQGSVHASATPAFDSLSQYPQYTRIWALNRNADGSGCGFHGWGGYNETEISRYQCNAGRPSFLHHTEGNLAQKQCFDANGAVTVSRISHVPMSNCSKPLNQVGKYGQVDCCGYYDYTRFSTTRPAAEQVNGWEIQGNWLINESHSFVHDLINTTTDTDLAGLRTPALAESGLP